MEIGGEVERGGGRVKGRFLVEKMPGSLQKEEKEGFSLRGFWEVCRGGKSLTILFKPQRGFDQSNKRKKRGESEKSKAKEKGVVKEWPLKHTLFFLFSPHYYIAHRR